jgi:hypothetical protein
MPEEDVADDDGRHGVLRRVGRCGGVDADFVLSDRDRSVLPASRRDPAARNRDTGY